VNGILQRGRAATERLHSTLRPHFLRREKSVINAMAAAAVAAAAATSSAAAVETRSDADGSCGVGVGSAIASESGSTMAAMPVKKEVVVWIRPSAIQLQLYTRFLQSSAVRDVLMMTQGPLAALNVLRKICLHPALLNDKARSATGAEAIDLGTTTWIS
jgi:hypothetical protein